MFKVAVGLQAVGGCGACTPPPDVSNWAAGALCLQTAISATGPCGRNAPQEAQERDPGKASRQVIKT